MTDDADREYFIGLMKKFNAVAVKLPHEADIINKDTRTASVAKARSLLREMQQQNPRSIACSASTVRSTAAS